MNHERKRFLDEDRSDVESDEGVPSTVPRQRRTHRVLFIAQSVFLTVNLLLLWSAYSIRYGGDGDGSTSIPLDAKHDKFHAAWSPAQAAIDHSVQVINTHPEHSPFWGEPRPELDQAWSDLLYPTIIRLEADEMHEMNKTSIALRDGSGYVGYVEAYHMLHCVKRIYQFQYPESYPDLMRAGKLTLGHWNHCLDVLRRGIMCNADPGLNTYSWDPAQPTEVVGHTMWPRKCVNWSQFSSWAHERALGLTWRDQVVNYYEEGVMGPEDLL